MTVDYKALAARAAEVVDHTETPAGGDFEKTIIPAGITIGRFIEYIELGDQPQRAFKGEAKPNHATARFTFELLHKRHAHEIEVDGKKVTVYDRFSFKEAIKLGEKARFKKLFKTMTYGRSDITHFAQMLNDPFILNFEHNEGEKDGKKVTYVNLYVDGKYGIQPPVVSDPIAGTTTPVPVPAANSPIKIFLWDLPTKETWDSLYIPGTRTVKEGKTEKEVSKNWLQETILEASNFTGSPLEDMLTGSAELTAAVEQAEEVAKPAAKKPVAAQPAKTSAATAPSTAAVKTATKTASPSKVAPVVKKTTAAKPKEQAAIDPLAALGL